LNIDRLNLIHQDSGKVERSDRIDEEEFYRMLQGVVIDDSKLFKERLRECGNFYNFQRPHGFLSGQTPFERLKEKLKEFSLTEVTL